MIIDHRLTGARNVSEIKGSGIESERTLLTEPAVLCQLTRFRICYPQVFSSGLDISVHTAYFVIPVRLYILLTPTPYRVVLEVTRLAMSIHGCKSMSNIGASSSLHKSCCADQANFYIFQSHELQQS